VSVPRGKTIETSSRSHAGVWRCVGAGEALLIDPDDLAPPLEDQELVVRRIAPSLIRSSSTMIRGDALLWAD
jgi:hypothetical protein